MRLPSLLLAVLLAGCAGSAPRSTPPPAATSAPPVVASTVPAPMPTRALPREVVPPRAFEQAIRNGTRTADGRPGSNYWQQSARYTLEARLFPEEKRLEGTARIVYQNDSPHSLNELRLEIAQNMHAEGALRHEAAEVTGGANLHRVVVNGDTLQNDARPGYLVEGTQLVIVPPDVLASGRSATLEIDWDFTIPQGGASGRMGYSEDNLFFLAYWYPQMSVYDDVYGWMTDPFTGGAEFYADFADYDLTVEAPAGWIIDATGSLQNPDSVLAPAVAARLREAHASDTPSQVVGPADFATATLTPEDGRLRWHFTAQRVRDAAFSATRASIWEAARTPVGDRDGDGRTDYAHVHTFYRESAPRWANVTRYQQHALTAQSAFTGLPYPWPHMTAVEGSGIIGGGMEYPMMTLMGDYNALGDSALYYVTAHELAHMWVPMVVSTNERRYSWMDEGMTSFLENHVRSDFFPGSNHHLPDLQEYLITAYVGEESEMMRWSDYHYPGNHFVIASYRKPASVLVALRSVLGEATFMEGYRTFLREWAYKHPYPWDFFNTMERVAGEDLDWFWEPWYYTTWTLDQAIRNVQVTTNGARIVVEDLGQIAMPVHLLVTLSGGETLRITIPVDTWLQGATEATVEVQAPSPVARVEIDPERAFPDIDPRNNVWPR